MSRRTGVTLIECLVFGTLALVIAAGVWSMVGRADALFEETARSMDLDVSARNLMENLTRDVRECQQVMDPGQVLPGLDPAHVLVVVEPATDGVDRRLSANPDAEFPFSAIGMTTQKMDVLRVVYVWDAARRTVSRREEPGWLVADADADAPPRLTRFRFEPEGPVSERTLATRVAAFDLSYVAYEPGGALELLPSGTVAFERTACVVVHLDCRVDEGVFQAGRPQPRVELVTKVWSTKRRADEVYGEYFSSTDEDLRW